MYSLSIHMRPSVIVKVSWIGIHMRPSVTVKVSWIGNISVTSWSSYYRGSNGKCFCFRLTVLLIT